MVPSNACNYFPKRSYSYIYPQFDELCEVFFWGKYLKMNSANLVTLYEFMGWLHSPWLFLFPVISIWNSGSEFGLSLVINIEQYEYLPGPISDAGIKVIVHYRWP